MGQKVSVIIPVYNVENYIYECLISVLNQTYDNLEIIVVNDGSKDNSINIIKEISDDRIKIINKENGGLSSARNVGISNATGEYIVFLDSDDYWNKDNCLEQIIQIFLKNDCDVVVGKSIRAYEDRNEYKHNIFFENLQSEVYSNIEYLKIVSNYNWVPVCFYCFKSKVLTNSKIRFKEGVLHEDEDFTLRILLYAKSIGIYNEYFYVYRQREGSITKNISLKNIKDIIKIMLDLDSTLNNINDKYLKNILRDRAVKKILRCVYYYNYRDLNLETKKFILRNSTSISTKVCSYLIRLSPSLYFYYEVLKSKLNIPSKFE